MIPITKAKLARLRGCSRSAVSQATRPGGALYEALCEDGRRVDRDHPATRKWLGRADVGAPSIPRDTTISYAELAERAGVSHAEVEALAKGRLRDAVVPSHHISISDFATLASCEPAEVAQFVGPAVTAAGRVDTSHPAALEHLCDPTIDRPPLDLDTLPEGFLGPAWSSGAADTGHPLVVATAARMLGRLPVPEDFEEAQP